MTTGTTEPRPQAPLHGRPSGIDKGWGWRIFAGTMIGIGGLFNIIDGLVGIWNTNYFRDIAQNYHVAVPVVDNLHTWGWVALIFGIVMIVTALGVFADVLAARVVGVIVAGLNMVFQLGFLGTFPFWSFTMILVDVLVIYGLVVHAERDLT